MVEFQVYIYNIKLVLVDRELETYIIEKLHEFDLGPKIYETDMKTYRVEQYLDHLVTLKNEDMFKDTVLDKLLHIFSIYNSLGDWKYYEAVFDLEEYLLNNTGITVPCTLECKIVNNNYY